MMNKIAITILKKGILFLGLFVVVDLVLGNLTSILFFQQSSGKYERITSSLEKAEGQFFIFGSSHANRNYVPEVLEKTTGLSCYNAGVQGQQILFHTTLQEIILNRTQPEMILLTLDPNWLYADKKVYDLMADLHPYYWKYKEEIDPVLQLKSPYESWKMYINAYRFNSTIVHILKYMFFPQEDFKGYRPLYGTALLPETDVAIPIVKREAPLDSNFIRALEGFIEKAQSKEIELVFAISPRYNRVDYSENSSWKTIKSIANAKGIPFYDYLFHEDFIEQKDVFYDAIHLNHKGALHYSEIIGKHIKQDFNIKNVKDFSRQE